MAVNELSIKGVYYSGDKREHVELTVNEECVLSDFMVMDNTYDKNGELSNKNRHVHRFRPIRVYKGDSIELYSLADEDPVIPEYNGSSRIIKLYWGLGSTIWNETGDIVHLIKIAAQTKKRFK